MHAKVDVVIISEVRIGKARIDMILTYSLNCKTFSKFFFELFCVPPSLMKFFEYIKKLYKKTIQRQIAENC